MLPEEEEAAKEVSSSSEGRINNEHDFNSNIINSKKPSFRRKKSWFSYRTTMKRNQRIIEDVAKDAEQAQLSAILETTENSAHIQVVTPDLISTLTLEGMQEQDIDEYDEWDQHDLKYVVLISITSLCCIPCAFLCFGFTATHYFKQLVKKDASLLKKAPACLRDREAFVGPIVNVNVACLEYVPYSYREDEPFLRNLHWGLHEMVPFMIDSSTRIKFIAESYMSHPKILQYLVHKDTALRIVLEDGRYLQYMTDEMRRDREIVTKACSKSQGFALEFAAEPLKCDVAFLVDTFCESTGDFSWVQFVPRDVRLTHEIKGLISMICPSIELKNQLTLIMHFASALMNDEEFVVWISNDDVKVALLLALIPEALAHLPRHWLEDKNFILSLAPIQQEAFWYSYVQPPLNVDIDVVRKAVTYDSTALQNIGRDDALQIIEQDWHMIAHFSDDIQSDMEIIERCLAKSSLAFKYASMKLKNSVEFVLPLVSKNGSLLQYVSVELKNNKRICLEAVSERGFALRFAAAAQRNDHDIVLAAVSNDGSALQYASPNLQANRQIVTEAITQNSTSFKFVHASLRADREVVMFAVTRNARNLQYALGGLNQDRDCWIAAGLSNEEISRPKEGGVSVVLSTRYALTIESQSSVTGFTKLLAAHPYFKNGFFEIYSPNAFAKDTCDPEWTQLDWPCRGTSETCLLPLEFRDGRPTASSCWRYSFRWHLEHAKETSGFLIQVVDAFPDESGCVRYQLGRGQKIESSMADTVGTKVFKVFQPCVVDLDTGRHLYTSFDEAHINELVQSIQFWYETHCADPDVQLVVFEESMGV